ncbi:MAG: DUF1801 domain-containing protein [Pseudomonadota bacterium]
MAETKKPSHSSSTNPCIPKGDGDEPVQAYISAMQGWKSALGKRIDETVEKVFPDVRKQVRWNTPFYGKEDGWFLAMYCYKDYVQITFLTGSSLDPIPPKASKVEGTRYLDIYEDDGLDDAQLADWVQQALKLPGQKL